MHGLLFYHQLLGTGRQVSFLSEFPFLHLSGSQSRRGKRGSFLKRSRVHAHVGQVLPLPAPPRKLSPPCSTVDRAQGRRINVTSRAAHSQPSPASADPRLPRLRWHERSAGRKGVRVCPYSGAHCHLGRRRKPMVNESGLRKRYKVSSKERGLRRLQALEAIFPGARNSCPLYFLS